MIVDSPPAKVKRSPGDAAILATFRATGIRIAELAAIRYHPNDPGRSDLDLERREVRVRGKGGRDRTIRIDHDAAGRLDRHLRARARRDHGGAKATPTSGTRVMITNASSPLRFIETLQDRIEPAGTIAVMS